MNLSKLTKEQKQYFALGGIGVAVAVVVLVMGVKWSLSSISKAKDELADLTDKVERADRALSRKDRTQEDFEASIVILEEHISHAPPEENFYSWATEIIYSNGRVSGLEIESVEEIASSTANESEQGEVKFESYAIRVKAHGGYEHAKTFLRHIEAEHPLVRFTGMEISSGQTPDSHDVQLFLQWPFKVQELAKNWEGYEFDRAAVAKAATEPDAESVEEPTPQPKEKPALAPVVAKKEPKPAPVVVKAEPKPEPIAEPVVAQAEKPAPAPVVVKQESKPAPVVVKAEPKPDPIAEPVVAQAEKPAPVVVKEEPKPAPVVVKAEPKPEPIEEPVVVQEEKPAPAPDVVKEEPKPAPVVVKAEPKPESIEEPVVVHEEKPAPAPVVVKEESKPAAQPNDNLGSIMASIDAVEESPAKEEPKLEVSPEPAASEEPAVQPADNEMSSLLASLDSHGEEATVVDDANSATDAASLEAYMKQLEEGAPESSESSEVSAAEVEEPAVISSPAAEPSIESVEPEPIAAMSGEETQYVSSSKSAKKLEEILGQGKPKTSASLGSFLDGLGGGR